ncbi:hypothetical protein ACFONC_03325 [Luteimonas soli]|uniref:Uncharacterized protein n=1 Tax=Luteimonas soli TaxID=1648966 RepID=A0ABV7XHE8_9GAMM
MSANLAVLPLVDRLAEQWGELTADDHAMIEEDYPKLVELLGEITDRTQARGVRDRPAASPATSPSLAEALSVADHASPAPAQAHAALQVLRQALADALAMSVEELQRQSVGYPAGRI